MTKEQQYQVSAMMNLVGQLNQTEIQFVPIPVFNEADFRLKLNELSKRLSVIKTNLKEERNIE